MAEPVPAPGWRRLCAFALDYLAIAAYLAVLGVVSVAVRRIWGVEPRPASPRERLLGQALAFLVLTLPVALYFALSESSPRGATPGKRALGLRVVTMRGGRVPKARALRRAAVKFAPWELAHTAIWQMPGAFTAAAAPTALNLAGYVLSVLLAGWYAVSLFTGARRTPYDRAAETRVVAA